MARVTVEDCITQVPNRFELVALAARRAKSIAAGAPLSIDRDNDKDTVVALREIADQTVDLDHIREDVVQNFQRRLPMDQLPGSESDRVDSEVMESMEDEIHAMDEAVADKPSLESRDGMSFDDENLDVED